MQSLLLIICLFGFLVAGMFGTETRLLFFWPGAAVLGLAGLLATLKWRLRVLFPPSEFCLLTALLFGSYLTVRAFLSPVAAYAREDMIVLAACAVVYLLTATAASHPRWRGSLLAVLLLLAVGNLAAGAVQWSGHWEFNLVPHFFRAAEPGRIGGFFANANHLAAFLSFALFLSAGWVLLGRGRIWIKILLGLLMVAIIAGIALTVSRGALLGIIAGAAIFGCAILWLLWQTHRQFFWPLLIGGGLVIGIGGIVVWKASEEYLQGRMARSPMTEDVRFGIWEAALTQNAQSPVFGTGARTFYDGSIRYRSPKLPVYAEEALFAHNEVLQTAADYGWLGVGLLGLVVLAHLGNGLRFLSWFVHHKFVQTGRLVSSNLGMTVGALAALAATLVHACFEFHFHVPATSLAGAAVFGVLANPGIEFGIGGKPPMRLPGVRLAGKLLLSAASLGLLAGTFWHGRGDYYFALSQIDHANDDRSAQFRHLSQSIAADPTSPEPWYQRGLLRLNSLNANQRSSNQSTLREAVADLEAAVALNPSAYLHQLALADGYDAEGRYEDALAAIHNAIVMAPLHEEPRLALGMHWHRLGEFEKAEMAYLWAGQAKAWNEEGTTRWTDSYKLLLEHAALMRGQKTKP